MSTTKLMLTLSLLVTLAQAIPAQNPGTWKRASLNPNDVPIVTLHGAVNDRPKYFLQEYPEIEEGDSQTKIFYAEAQPSSEGTQLTQINSQDGSDSKTSFDFIPVDSAFMGYSNEGCLGGDDDSLCYGHLRLSGSADDSGLGLIVSVADPGRAITQIPTLDKESESDDSGQLLQFWSYKQSTGDLTFLGISQNPNATYSSEYQGPYGAEGYKESKGFVMIANKKDAEGSFVFDHLD